MVSGRGEPKLGHEGLPMGAIHTLLAFHRVRVPALIGRVQFEFAQSNLHRGALIGRGGGRGRDGRRPWQLLFV